MKLANRPQFKKYVFAQEATNDTIEPVPDTQTETKEAQGYIGYQKGYTINNMKPLTEGGKPPRGQQLNQLLKDITSVTQYATAGGTYDLDQNISNDNGYPKNALITNDSGVYRSLQDDNKVIDLNNKNYWQRVISFNPQPNRSIGSLFYSMKNSENGALLCNGNEYNISNYPDLQPYLDNNEIVNYDFTQWDTSTRNNNGNVGYFGYEKSTGKFRTPCIMSGAYLSPGNLPNGDITVANRGRYHGDQIVNIIGRTDFWAASRWLPDFYSENCLVGNHAGSKGLDMKTKAYDDWTRRYQIWFDASKSPGVNVGDRVMPRTIFHNLFVVVSNRWSE